MRLLGGQLSILRRPDCVSSPPSSSEAVSKLSWTLRGEQYNSLCVFEHMPGTVNKSVCAFGVTGHSTVMLQWYLNVKLHAYALIPTTAPRRDLKTSAHIC